MIQPSPFHIKVTRSALDTTEEQRPSGLIVQHDAPPEDHVLRGVVEAVGSHAAEHYPELTIGDVLFYLEAVTLGGYDFVICNAAAIIGWEAA